MKNSYTRLFLATVASVFFASCLSNRASDQAVVAEGPPPAIVPLPNKIVWGENMYILPEVNTICFNPGAEKAAGWLQELLKNTNSETEFTQGDSCGNINITADLALQEQLGEEGYMLNISAEGINLTSATEAGLFYGIQSLRQFFPAEIEQDKLNQDRIFLRHVAITDKPEYEWRGTMVDVARSFFGLEYLKDHVDRMALYKLNRLHLHLTDDQGWRIEIKSKPLLTEIGSKGSVTGGNSGYLTQEEYIELQDYALARHIVIIPEVDMPGHIYSALVAYPELNCDQNSNIEPKMANPPELYSGYEVGWSKFCLEKPEIYDFVADVIGELAEITRGPWIHIGGDEIHDPLYEEFVAKADSIVLQNEKTSIGWEEATKALVSESFISQQWHGKTEGVVNRRVIESICTNFYFDHANIPGQENTLNWCKEDGVSLENAYSFVTNDPNVIGIEAPVWTEHVLNDQMMDDRFWPRTLAVAEVAWTSRELRDFSNFKDRLKRHGSRLQEMGIHYFPTPEIEWEAREIGEEAVSVFSEYVPKT